MEKIKFSTVGSSPALTQARNHLAAWGYEICTEIDKSITHLLFPVPSLDKNNMIRGGPNLYDVLGKLNCTTTIMGGMLPELPLPSVDFLKDPYYVSENASITAYCAINIIVQNVGFTLKDAPILIIGWGRIGKCLAQLLRTMGANVTIAVRKTSDCAILHALGYNSIIIEDWNPQQFKIIINTVPAPILNRTMTTDETLCLDLASEKGIFGENVLWERGLPGRLAPETSGLLIAKTALRYALRKE